MVSLVNLRSIAWLERVCRKQTNFFPYSFFVDDWERIAICNQAETSLELRCLGLLLFVALVPKILSLQGRQHLRSVLIDNE